MSFSDIFQWIGGAAKDVGSAVKGAAQSVGDVVGKPWSYYSDQVSEAGKAIPKDQVKGRDTSFLSALLGSKKDAEGKETPNLWSIVSKYVGPPKAPIGVKDRLKKGKYTPGIVGPTSSAPELQTPDYTTLADIRNFYNTMQAIGEDLTQAAASRQEVKAYREGTQEEYIRPDIEEYAGPGTKIRWDVDKGESWNDALRRWLLREEEERQ